MQTDILSTSEILEFGGMRTRVLAGLPDAPSTVMEMHVEPGGGAPAHRSHDCDKVFVVLEGRLVFRLGDKDGIDVSAGEAVAVARGDVHGFTNPAEEPARLLLTGTPAAHDAFFRAMAALPVPHALDDVRRVCRIWQQEIVGL
ncbi:cupin domain-containing protein [Paraburkholderia sp. J12]|uniref:cupin domain-containing protein n=1 Tax=Paraburkholderia sp. J12 TaxID=2805432 RepID=UPI002ABDD7E2|nr:cupin domain-containing protein [Paraburkholderia sp. J12]